MAEKKTEPMVKIRLPKTRELADDVFVSVNDRSWVIKRGVTVEVPECVAEVLQHQETMEQAITDFDDLYAGKDDKK